jgi:hypothetical protein
MAVNMANIWGLIITVGIGMENLQDFGSRAGSNGAVMCQQHYVTCDKTFICNIAEYRKYLMS